MTEENKTKLNQLLSIDIQNEKIAIGHMLQDEKSAINGTRMLKAKHFVTPYAAFIIKIIQSCIEQGKSISDIHFRINSIAAEDWKKIAPEINVTCQRYINDCMAGSVVFLGSDIVAEGVFKKVQSQELRRSMYTAYQEAMDKVLNTTDTKDLQEIVGDISTKSNEILDGMLTTEEESYQELGLRILNSKEQLAISAGFNKLDEIIDGFRPGQLITIGAGTGVGKSAFAVNLALNIAGQGHTVGLWSFEMDKAEIFQRILSNKTGYYRKSHRPEERYNASRKYLDNTNDDIQLFTTPIRDLSNFYLQCRKLSIQGRMKVVIIDYLQLIHLNKDYGTNRVAEIEMITNSLKLMASDLGITIVILSQLSRAYQKREDKRPILSDLRDSGSIEQDSNVVLLLNKPDQQPSHYQKYEKCIELIVAKNRSGQSGSFFMKYNGGLTTFVETNNGGNRV
jgi:replicative DNA helicase